MIRELTHLHADVSREPVDSTALEVSIIILNWNKSELTLNCVESVVRHTQSRYEIIVVDNGSRPSELAALKAGLGHQVRLISLSRNLFFGEGNNIAAEASRGKFVLFLNNDVTILSDVVSDLISEFDKCFSAGAIGPKFKYPNGTTQEAGAFLLPDGLSLRGGQLGQSIDPHFWRGCHIVDYCSAACLLVERSVFIELGGFDPLFDPAYYEDCDFCLRLRSTGLYTYFASEVEVVHDENVTSREVWGQDKIRGIVSVNHRRFLARWKDYLEHRITESNQPRNPFPLVKSYDTRNEMKDHRPQLLLKSERTLELLPGSRAVLSAAAALQSTFAVTIALPEICSTLRVRLLCRHFGLQLDRVGLVRLSKFSDVRYDYAFSIKDPESGESAGEENGKTMKEIYKLVDAEKSDSSLRPCNSEEISTI